MARNRPRRPGQMIVARNTRDPLMAARQEPSWGPWEKPRVVIRIARVNVHPGKHLIGAANGEHLSLVVVRNSRAVCWGLPPFPLDLIR